MQIDERRLANKRLIKAYREDTASPMKAAPYVLSLVTVTSTDNAAKSEVLMAA